MVSRVFRDRELNWIRTARDAFTDAKDELEPSRDARRKLIAERVAGLVQLTEVGGRERMVLEVEHRPHAAHVALEAPRLDQRTDRICDLEHSRIDAVLGHVSPRRAV
jgi:hypothetical protein